jgi:hypothetical protein
MAGKFQDHCAYPPRMMNAEVARLIIAIARDVAREDHERELAAYNPGPAL